MSCSAVCFLWWAWWGHMVDEANLLSCEDAGSLLQITRMHAAALHSHVIWRLPSADACSHSAHHLFRAVRMFSPSHPHTAALDSPNIKQSAYLHLYCVYQSGSHYSCEAAAINSRQEENGGRNSQLMIKKWQLASSFHSSRAGLFVSWQIWTSKLKINHFPFSAATNYNKLCYWLWFFLIM